MTHRIFKVLGLASAAFALSVTLTIAGGHAPYEKRQAAMKVVGGSAKTIGDMLKGTTAFDAAKANAALAAMQEAVAPYGDFFPEGSEAPQSEASPAIWSDRAGFDATLAAFQADIADAVSAAPQDQAGMAAAFGAVTENCGTCHKAYRVKK
ncbi:MAG: cytochrome c [Pseudomonadota bacterium]